MNAAALTHMAMHGAHTLTAAIINNAVSEHYLLLNGLASNVKIHATTLRNKHDILTMPANCNVNSINWDVYIEKHLQLEN